MLTSALNASAGHWWFIAFSLSLFTNRALLTSIPFRNVSHKNLETHLDDHRALLFIKLIRVLQREGEETTEVIPRLAALCRSTSRRWRSTEAGLPHSTAALSVLQFHVSVKVHDSCPPEGRRKLQGKTNKNNDKIRLLGFFFFFFRMKNDVQNTSKRVPCRRYRQYTKGRESIYTSHF